VAIILTAFAGAAWFTAGIALFVGLILPEDMPNGSLVAIYAAEGWLWILIWGLVAAVGIVAQLQMTKRWEQDIVAVYSTRNPM
jgi:hypothetical protein